MEFTKYRYCVTHRTIKRGIIMWIIPYFAGTRGHAVDRIFKKAKRVNTVLSDDDIMKLVVESRSA